MVNEIEKIEMEPLVEINVEETTLPVQVQNQMKKAINDLQEIEGLQYFFKIKDLNKVQRGLLCSILLANYKDEPKAGIMLIGGFAFLIRNSYFFGFEGGIPTFAFTKEWGMALTKLAQESAARFFSGNDGGYSMRRQGPIVAIKSYNEQRHICDISYDKLISEWEKANAAYNAFSVLLKQELLVRLEKQIPEQLMIHTF